MAGILIYYPGAVRIIAGNVADKCRTLVISPAKASPLRTIQKAPRQIADVGTCTG